MRMDFTKYSDSELLESLNSIDKEKYSHNYDLLEKEINRRGFGVSEFVSKISEARDAVELKEYHARSGIKTGHMNLKGEYVPNEVSLAQRVFNVVLSIGLVSYGIFGVAQNDLYLPGKRGRGIHLHDFSTVLCLIAFIIFGMTLISMVIDHYDRRKNETKYLKFQKTTSYVAVAFLIFAIAREAVGSD